MKSRPTADRHVEHRIALDYLDGTLDAPGRRGVEAHLGLPCAVCHERIRALGALVHRMRLDRVPPVPESLHARALGVFDPGARPSAVRQAAEHLARLLFDSWADPLPAAARRALGEARRLRFQLEGGTFELECETESQDLVTLRGRIEIEDAPLHRVEVLTGAESRVAWPDADGAFALDRVPAGEARVRIEGPAVCFTIPPLTL